MQLLYKYNEHLFNKQLKVQEHFSFQFIFKTIFLFILNYPKYQTKLNRVLETGILYRNVIVKSVYFLSFRLDYGHEIKYIIQILNEMKKNRTVFGN